MRFTIHLNRYVRSLVLPAALAISLAGLSAASVATAATMTATGTASSSSQTSCSGNFVIPGGVTSAADLQQKFSTNFCGIQPLYNFFGITSVSDFDGMVTGHVDTANNVYVDSANNTVHTLVAKDAITAGRDNISNDSGTSTPILGGTFFKRPPAVSFASGTLGAMIKMDANGKFLFAVITSCGNPVMATPVVQPKPTPPPAAPTQPPAPTPPAPAPAKPAAARPTQLVNTGAGNAVLLFVGVAALGALLHHLYTRRLVR